MKIWKYSRFAFIVLLLVNCFCSSGSHNKQPVDYVNPFICTQGDHGHQHPGATVPWGMVILGPDTYPSSLTGNGNWAHSGYNYADSYVRGFSHLRIVGSGGTNSHDREKIVTFLLGVGKPEIAPEKRFSRIDKSTEKATPGFYSVLLDNGKIQVDLTATTHAGFHQYTFPGTDQAYILLKFGNVRRNTGAYLKISSPTEIIGKDSNWLFFYIQIEKPFKTVSTWRDTTLLTAKEVTGGTVGALLNFETDTNEVIHAKIGFSTISIEDAKNNLQTEIPNWDFDSCVSKARQTWADRLNVIELEGNEEYKEIFYTHLYQSYITPNNITDVNGQYTGTDGNIHKAEGYHHYDNYAFWDDYRTKYPLLTLTQPDVYKDIICSVLDIYEQGLLTRPYLTCRHEHMIAVVTDAFAKGLSNENIEKAYPNMIKYFNRVSFRRRDNITEPETRFGKIGFVPKRPDLNLEYAYDSWCASQLAKILGKEDDVREYARRSKFYKNVWDTNAVSYRGEADNIYGFFRARAADGEWLEFPHDPRVIDEKFVYEGSMWHWRWFVPHDVNGLIELIGGNEKFVHDFDYFFDCNLYQPGNQPDLHAPFLFNYAGAPWLTQKYVRRILTEPMTNYFGTHEFFDKPIHDRVYKATPDGYLLEMDDDYGCMAAWYVMSAMGLYQVCVGDPVYQLTAPIFEKVILYLDKKSQSEKSFTIVAKNLSAKNIYIQSATLNDQPYNRCRITHQEIVNGGTLVFEMGDKPNKNWGNQVD